MALICLDKVELNYPVRRQQGIALKEFIVRGLFLKKRQPEVDFVHALRGVSCTIKEGERVGVIGSNGAGKSTILRTIAGVYPLSAGTRTVEGKVSSLFDINLGFDMESSGQDNIFHRSLLQGETPRSIRRKYESIAEFTELGEFLKLPIKYYSSGMLMRLAFSVATSHDPEILLIDEVFGTGDLGFQQKAQARLVDLMKRAKIVVMVGHNLPFLDRFCTRVLWLDHGVVRAEGPTHDVIMAYHQDVQRRYELSLAASAA